MAAWGIASPTVSGLSFPCRDCPSLCGRALLGSHASEDRRSETARPQKTATCPVILPNGAVTRHGAVALDWPDLARPTESCLSGGGGAKAGWPAMMRGDQVLASATLNATPVMKMASTGASAPLSAIAHSFIHPDETRLHT